MTQQICRKDGCNRYAWVESRTGIQHLYCGRTHAKECEGNKLQPPHGSCHVCNFPGCNKNVAFDNTTGRVHDFCCRDHANSAISQKLWSMPMRVAASKGKFDATSTLCGLNNCNLPCFIDGSVTYDFCGRTHAILAKQDPSLKRKIIHPQPSQTKKIANPIPHHENQLSLQPSISSVPLCGPCDTSKKNKLPHECLDCNERKVHEWICINCNIDNDSQDPNCIMCGSDDPKTDKTAKQQISQCGLPGCCKSAVYYGFCGKPHLDRAVEKQMLPPMGPPGAVERVLHDGNYNFTVHLLTNRHKKYTNIKDQFTSMWQHPSYDQPRVERVFWIRVNDKINERFKSASLKLGGVCRRFHGTSQLNNCMFGTNPAVPPCDDALCNICSICRKSFLLSNAKSGGGRRMHLRYGEGLYFSPVSSKSHDYNELSERVYKDRRYRSMFLCNVVTGKQFVTKKDYLPDSHCPPPQYDSVVAEAGDGLNYPEVVVYNEEHVIPTYLIIYSMP